MGQHIGLVIAYLFILKIIWSYRTYASKDPWRYAWLKGEWEAIFENGYKADEQRISDSVLETSLRQEGDREGPS